MCQFVIGPLTQNREAPNDTNQRAAHACGKCYHLFLYFYFKNLIRTLWSVTFLSLYSFPHSFTALFRESAQTLHWKPCRSSNLLAGQFANISNGILSHLLLSLNLCIYSCIRICIFIKFHLYFFFFWIWSWRSVWVWQKPHELWIFSLIFCRFNELIVI